MNEKPKDKEVVEPKTTKASTKPENLFSTLVKMSSGRNPTTFTLPPELTCNTVFPGKENSLQRFFYFTLHSHNI